MTDTQRKLRLYVSDATILVMAAVVVLGLSFAFRRRDPSALGLLAFGWTLYLLEEYLVHRFIFHAPAPRRQFLFDLMYRLHYGHHDQVWSRHLLFTPMWFAVPLTVIDCAALSIFLSVEDVLICVCGGAGCAYLLFEWWHLTTHFKAASKGSFGRYITRRHSRHHFIDYTYWFTVSPGGQLVDRALGSDPRDYAVVPDVRTCGLPADDPRLAKSRLRYGCDTSLMNRRHTVHSIGAEIGA